jgi:glyoxylase-like metal-dependent hydrolase (beta-lactamase superfamily II)
MIDTLETARPVLFTGDVGGVRIGQDSPVMPPCPPPDIHIEDWKASIRILRESSAETLFLTHFGQINDKAAHLDALERRLDAWAEWMQPHFEQQTPAAEIVPLFEAYVEQDLRQSGVDDAGIERYSKANPSFMSVAGLLRYWKKRTL